jgi:hypothetical protein
MAPADLPPPLPPGERTVGQLVAETIRLYGRRFWRSLALGVGPAVLAVLSAGLSGWPKAALTLAVGPFVLGGSLVGATLLAAGGDRRVPSLARALVAALLAFAPVVASRLVVFPGVYLLALAWFALTALAVPAVLVEGRSVPDAIRRGFALARADLVHALGAVATLVIVVILTSLVLFFLLASVGEQALPYAAFLTLLVLSPLFFLGAALLYFDQAARVRVVSGGKRKRRRNADVHPALDADGSGPADTAVEPGTASRGQP